ncbi:hypothetical protein [Burkholderia vietnamiensis]|uniref:hypothetical protein n=1 Tax=Burkholderia vietnamiensis TaxID=60552 RepID=UPI001CF4C343|nr:hypothetical protein [Burkholderia vietnamiensis]MCA7985174.1 hypothetical protein [Burkholderia vietnamiensis]
MIDFPPGLPGVFISGAEMARSPKKAEASAPHFSIDELLAESVLVRSPLWLNGKRKVAAIIADATVDPALLPENAIALVSLTAFPPGAPSRMMVDVPLYDGPQSSDVLPAAWLKR